MQVLIAMVIFLLCLVNVFAGYFLREIVELNAKRIKPKNQEPPKKSEKKLYEELNEMMKWNGEVKK